MPVVLLSRISHDNDSLQVRYVMEEKVDSFNVFTDDPVTIEECARLDGWNIDFQKNLTTQLSKFEPLFEISHALMSCVDFCDSDHLAVERHPTRMRMEAQSSIVKSVRAKVGVNEAPNFVEVSTLLDMAFGQLEYDVQAAALKMETAGYWKTLAMDAVGRDRNGLPIQGKTWVTTKESWFEEHVSSLKPNAGAVNVQIDPDDTIGEIYIVRTPMHHRDTFKVGYTTVGSDERARQLTATSGQPDHFQVMNTWSVKSPYKVEQEIHKALKQFRVSQSREFFSCKYRIIHDTIDRIVSASGLEV